MKILFLCHRIPYPPNKGDKLRAFNILKHLSQKHTIDLLTLADDKKDLRYQENLKSYCRQVETFYFHPFIAKLKILLYLFSSKPLTLPYFYHSKLKKRITQVISQHSYDLLFLYSSSMVQYVLNINAPPPKVIDFVDADSQKWHDYAKLAKFPKSTIYQSEGRKLGRYEGKIAPHFKAVTVVSDQEKKKLTRYVKTDNIYEVRNGIDLSLYEAASKFNGDNKDLLFIGGMFYFAYIDGILHFYKYAFSKIKKSLPNTIFYVVGADPVKKIRKLNSDKNMRITGFVPDIIPYLQKAAVYVVPLRMAPGIQNKILEAMAMRVPVVATPAAIAGIDAVPGRDLMVEEDPVKFASAVIQLLQKPDLRQKLAENARRLVENEYNWNKNLSKFDDIFAQNIPLTS
jgi:sugar transferase (PEP-CTERM/EpsH1 system associated)